MSGRAKIRINYLYCYPSSHPCLSLYLHNILYMYICYFCNRKTDTFLMWKEDQKFCMVHLLLSLQITLVVLLLVGLSKVVLPLGCVSNAWLHQIQPDPRSVWHVYCTLLQCKCIFHVAVQWSWLCSKRFSYPLSSLWGTWIRFYSFKKLWYQLKLKFK